MKDHECIIGLIYRYGGAEWTTLPGLKEYIQTEIIKFNESCRKGGCTNVLHTNWSLRDYADKRKNTNLKRFEFCPECGKRIDWAAIRKGDTDGRIYHKRSVAGKVLLHGSCYYDKPLWWGLCCQRRGYQERPCRRCGGSGQV